MKRIGYALCNIYKPNQCNIESTILQFQIYCIYKIQWKIVQADCTRRIVSRYFTPKMTVQFRNKNLKSVIFRIVKKVLHIHRCLEKDTQLRECLINKTGPKTFFHLVDKVRVKTPVVSHHVNWKQPLLFAVSTTCHFISIYRWLHAMLSAYCLLIQHTFQFDSMGN